MTQYVESLSSGVWRSQSATYIDVTNLRLTITTSGAPVLIQLVPAPSLGDPNGLIGCSCQAGGATFSFFRFMRDGAALPSMTMGSSFNTAAHGATLSLPCSALSIVDRPPAGDHVYALQARSANPTSIPGGPHTTSVDEAKLVAIAF